MYVRIRELREISVEFALYIFELYGIKFEVFFFKFVYLFVLCNFEFKASSKFIM